MKVLAWGAFTLALLAPLTATVCAEEGAVVDKASSAYTLAIEGMT